MKLSKNSFLKRISCIALSLMLCLTSFTLAGFAPTLEAEAAVNTYAEALNLTADSVDNLNPETFTEKAYFENDVATNGYSNVVYSSKGTDTSKYPGKPSAAFYTDNKIGQANYTVNVYDGTNEASAPVVYEASSNYGIYSRKVYYAALVNSSIFKLQQYWKGNITGNNWARWPLAVNSSATKDNVNYEANTNTSFSLDISKNSKHYFWNKVVYCGSGDKNNFYESINGLTFQIHGNKGDNKTATSTTVGHNYVINYRPIYDIIKGKETQKVTVGNTVTDYTFKALYKEVYENQDKYTEASQNTYFKAVKALLDLNVNSYFSGISDTNVDSQVKAAAAKIKKVYTDYNKAATDLVHVHSFTGDYVNNNDGSTHKQKCKYFDICGGYSVNEDHSYSNKGITDDKAKVQCSCGHYYELDYSVYNAELKTLDSMLAQTNKYTNIAECQKERDTVDTAAAAPDVLTQTQVDAKINELKEIEKKLTLQKYSIKFNVATVDGKTLETDITGTGTYEYGTMVELDLPEKYQTNYVVTTWKRNAKGVDKVVGGTSTKLYVVVNQESTYTAVINSVATDNVGDNAVLTLNNKSGKTIDVGFVETNKEQNVTVDINNSTITIGSVELTAPTYSFYTLKGFYIDKTPYSESGGTVTITKDTVITPYYDASLFVDIKRASGETFTINGDDKAPYTANWNQKVTLKSETEVYWYNENDVLLGKGTTYSFYANSEVTIHTEPVDSVQNVDPTASIGYFDYDSTLNKVTVVNNFFVPDGKNVTEAGVILSTKNSSVDALKKQTNGIFKGGPESFTSTGNQIRISVSRTANTKFTMYALAYVVVDGQKYFANEVKTINYTPQSA